MINKLMNWFGYYKFTPQMKSNYLEYAIAKGLQETNTPDFIIDDESARQIAKNVVANKDNV